MLHESGLFSSFFWEQESIQFVKLLEPSNYPSSLMCNFEMENFAGFCGHARPKPACNVPNNNEIQ